VVINIIILQCLNEISTARLTNHPYDDLWGSDGTYIFGEKASNGIYLVGDTVHLLWFRYGVGNRYNRSRDRGITWDYCSGSDCGGITVLSYYWESSIVAGGSKVHTVAYCWNCSGGSWIPYNRSLDGGTTWDYPTSGQTIFHSSEYGYYLIDAPSMDVSLNGDTILLVVDGFAPSYGLRLKRTFDGGNTWEPYGGIVVTYPSSTPEAHPQIAYNKMGKWFICYTDFPYIKVTYSTDYGTTWSTPVNLDTLVTNLGFNTCHVSAHGDHVAVVWFDKKGEAVNVYFRESTDGRITWSSKVNLTGLTSLGDTASGVSENYWNSFNYSAIGGLGINPWVMGGNYIGHWGFVDEKLDNKELFGGYQWGVGFGFRPSKYFEIFLNLLLGKYQVLLGKKGDQLYGPVIFFASNGQWDPYSPPLPQDIYYTSKVYLSQIGVRVIYPITKFIEPYLGLGLNIGSYEYAFSNKDASRAYSEILSGMDYGLNLTCGVNFNIILDNKIVLKFGPYFEIGHIVADGEMHDWIWEGWTYSNQFLITTYYRYGVIIGY